MVAESSATVTVEVTTPPRRGRQRASKKKRKVSDDEYSDEDEEIDTSKYGRASFSHKKRAAAIQPGKIDFCYVCSQRFTISPYTKQSPDGEGLLCHKCGAVEQSAPKKEAPKRKRMKVGKGTAKMILEGKEDRIGKLQDSCIKVIHFPLDGTDLRSLLNIFTMWRLLGILDLSTWIRFVRSFRGIVLSIMRLSLFSFNLNCQNYVFTTVPVRLATELSNHRCARREIGTNCLYHAELVNITTFVLWPSRRFCTRSHCFTTPSTRTSYSDRTFSNHQVCLEISSSNNRTQAPHFRNQRYSTLGRRMFKDSCDLLSQP